MGLNVYIVSSCLLADDNTELVNQKILSIKTILRAKKSLTSQVNKLGLLK